MNLKSKIIIITIGILCAIPTIFIPKLQGVVTADSTQSIQTQTEFTTDNTLKEQIVFKGINSNENLKVLNINEIEFPRVQFVPIPEKPHTLYNTLTDKEINLIEVTVQHEVGNFSDDYKTLIAELIYNRLVSDEFPDNITDILYQENQFCGIEYWYDPNYEVDINTKNIVEEVFSKNETSHNATYYYNPELSDCESVIWFEYSGDVEYLFEHTEESWGVKYTTRFFK